MSEKLQKALNSAIGLNNDNFKLTKDHLNIINNYKFKKIKKIVLCKNKKIYKEINL